MNQNREQLDPDRLVEAAEAALAAARDVAQYTGGPQPYPLDLMGTELQPEILTNFTRYEIEQACDFLVRLGEIEHPGKHPGRKAA